MNAPLVRFKHASLGYDRKPIVEDVDLEIRPGESWGIVGPNGAGKTTLLKTLLGLITPLRGEFRLTGSSFGKPRFGYVPQKDIIHMELTVVQALDYAAQLRMPATHAPVGGVKVDCDSKGCQQVIQDESTRLIIRMFSKYQQTASIHHKLL